ncbi:MAG: response regulator [Pricia sp.]|nr:response regulator [Pricia sp.]
MEPKSVLEVQPLVWVIDDDLVSLFATRYSIEQGKVSCKVVDFDCGETALQVFTDSIENHGKLPDIILLDLIMPNMDGWEFLNKIKAVEGQSKKTAIFILSAFTNSKDLERAKDHDTVQGYFEKPISKHNIEKIFQRELEYKKSL